MVLMVVKFWFINLFFFVFLNDEDVEFGVDDLDIYCFLSCFKVVWIFD